MAAPQNGKPLRIIGSIFKLAGTLVGTVVVTCKRIIGSSTPSKGPCGTSEKKPTQSPAKKKKTPTPKKKVIRRKIKDTAKNEVSGPSQDGLISETGAGTNTLAENQ